MSEEPRKRSRFDEEPAPAPSSDEPRRKSRFDRRSRSRSPNTKDRESTRDRSPVKSPANDAVAKAAEAAARINAQLQDKKGIQHVEVPPIRSSPSTGPGAAKSPSLPAPSGTLNAEIYQQDGDFIKDIEVNDLRNRYTLTKGSTQKTIKEETGADVTTRGNYYPDKSMATAANPPLYLHVTSTTKDGLEKAVAKIEELMKQELPNLIDERRFKRTREEREPVELDHKGRRKWPEKRIPIDLEPIPGFNLRAQVVGSGGSYVKHIQQETRCRVQIKGRGSGFMEHDTGRESDEQMYLHVAGPEQAQVDAAEEMCNSLLESVRESYEAFKTRGAQQRGPSGGGGGYGRQYNGGEQGGFGGRGDRHNSGSYGAPPAAIDGSGAAGYGGGYGQPAGFGQQAAYGQAQLPGGAQSPTAAAAAQQPTDPADQQKMYEAWAQYYAANPADDPYAAYGGYGAVMAQYMQGAYAQPQQAYQTPTPGMGMGGMGNGSVPPPPPPDEGNLPPPPPPGTSSNGHNAVPPPPGV